MRLFRKPSTDLVGTTAKAGDTAETRALQAGNRIDVLMETAAREQQIKTAEERKAEAAAQAVEILVAGGW